MKKLIAWFACSAFATAFGCTASVSTTHPDASVTNYPDAPIAYDDAPLFIDAGAPDGSAGSGYFNVAWTLTGAISPDADGCSAAGAASVIIHSDSATSSQKYQDVFDCTDGTDTTSALPLDDYNVWVEVDDSGGNEIAESDTAMASLTTDGATVTVPTFTFPWDAGYFGVTWTINGAKPDSATCTSIGSGGVDVTATLAGSSGTGFDDIFDCAAGQGVTSADPLGNYTVVVQIDDTSTPPQSLGTSMPQSSSLDYGNQLQDLGNFDFTF